MSCSGGWARSDVAEVKALRLGQRVEAVFRQRRAAAGVLDTSPHEIRVEIVAAVHVDRASLDARAELGSMIRVARPDRGGETVGAVIHERHSLVIIANFHD